MPSPILALIRALYRDCLTLVMFAGAVVGSFFIHSGIKQGCPLSGSIFALAIDPLLRAICVRSLTRSNVLRAYADDIGVVLMNVLLELPGLIQIFLKWELASLLKLNVKKCALIPLWCAGVHRLQRWLRRSLPSFSDCAVSNVAKYLGVMLGPGSGNVFWMGLEARLLTRAAEVRASDRGLATRIRQLSVYCTSLIAYRLRFQPPTKYLKCLYAKAAQRILAAPWNAMPQCMVTRLADWGMPFEIMDLERLSLASRARLAASSPSFQAVGRHINEAFDSDDRLLCPPSRFLEVSFPQCTTSQCI